MTDSGAFQQHAYGHVEVRAGRDLLLPAPHRQRHRDRARRLHRARRRHRGAEARGRDDDRARQDGSALSTGACSRSRSRADCIPVAAIPLRDRGLRDRATCSRSAAWSPCSSSTGSRTSRGSLLGRAARRSRPGAAGPPVRDRAPDDVRLRRPVRGRPVRLLVLPQVRPARGASCSRTGPSRSTRSASRRLPPARSAARSR